MLKNILDRIRGIPEKKRWIDLLTAALTVPVLLTVIISNYMNIQNRKEPESPASGAATSTPAINVIVENPSPIARDNIPMQSPDVPTPLPGESPQLKSGLPTYQVIFPQEGQSVSGDPLCVVHQADDNGYEPVRWSYRVNNSSWSPFSDAPICLYNMKEGEVTLEIKFRAQNGEEATYVRKFAYLSNNALPSSTPLPSGNDEA